MKVAFPVSLKIKGHRENPQKQTLLKFLPVILYPITFIRKFPLLNKLSIKPFRLKYFFRQLFHCESSPVLNKLVCISRVFKNFINLFERHTENFLLLVHSPNTHSRLGQTEVRSQEVNLGLPSGWQRGQHCGMAG